MQKPSGHTMTPEFNASMAPETDAHTLWSSRVARPWASSLAVPPSSRDLLALQAPSSLSCAAHAWTCTSARDSSCAAANRSPSIRPSSCCLCSCSLASAARRSAVSWASAAPIFSSKACRCASTACSLSALRLAIWSSYPRSLPLISSKNFSLASAASAFRLRILPSTDLFCHLAAAASCSLLVTSASGSASVAPRKRRPSSNACSFARSFRFVLASCCCPSSLAASSWRPAATRALRRAAPCFSSSACWSRPFRAVRSRSASSRSAFSLASSSSCFFRARNSSASLNCLSASSTPFTKSATAAS
mmetsp:Transcript_85592/g.237231  ORF Transcript_85592/g.237231 Transcript_85592/m.237231 type:complete len:305 (+) Transcript_85592:334-1248(+)